MPMCVADDNSTLIQVMAWCCRKATSHYLNQWWPSLLNKRTYASFCLNKLIWKQLFKHARIEMSVEIDHLLHISTNGFKVDLVGFCLSFTTKILCNLLKYNWQWVERSIEWFNNRKEGNDKCWRNITLSANSRNWYDIPKPQTLGICA